MKKFRRVLFNIIDVQKNSDGQIKGETLIWVHRGMFHLRLRNRSFALYAQSVSIMRTRQESSWLQDNGSNTIHEACNTYTYSRRADRSWRELNAEPSVSDESRDKPPSRSDGYRGYAPRRCNAAGGRTYPRRASCTSSSSHSGFATEKRIDPVRHKLYSPVHTIFLFFFIIPRTGPMWAQDFTERQNTEWNILISFVIIVYLIFFTFFPRIQHGWIWVN